MLETNSTARAVVKDLSQYLTKVLRTDVQIHRYNETGDLPTYLTDLYGLYSGTLLGHRCVFMVADGLPGAYPTIAKHTAAVARATGAIAVLTIASMNGRSRDSLIEAGVPFVVPGNQLFIPDLATDLREHFVTDRFKRFSHFKPMTQCIVLDRLLRPHGWNGVTSALSSHLDVTPMSIIRSFDELESVGLVEGIKRGRERAVFFKEQGLALFERCLPMFRTPVMTVRSVWTSHPFRGVPAAGESALAILTDLSSPPKPVYAVAAREWARFSGRLGIRNVPDGNVRIESWCYDPAKLSRGDVVDPLSLFIQFRDAPDQRLAIAAEQLLEGFPW